MSITLEEFAGIEEEYTEENIGVIQRLNEDGIVLPQKANENFINYNSNTFKVVRLPYTSASEKSVMCFPKNTVTGSFTVERDMPIEELVEIIKDALVKSGVEAYIDGDSSQRNDVVDKDGRKIVGAGQYKYNGVQGNKFFVSTNDASHIVKHVEYPEDYMDRKNMDDASQRIGTVNLNLQKFQTSFKEVCKNRGINLELVENPEINNSEQYIVEPAK